MSIAGLLPPALAIKKGSIKFDGLQLDTLGDNEFRHLRGHQIGFIFQNPLTAFNPTMCIGDQIAEILVRHKSLPWKLARQQAITLLERMGVSLPQQRSRQFPFEFSGGMLQRAMIAMAVACKPRLLIADEPTTALDVTVQAQVLHLLRELQHEHNMALLLVTHDLAVVSEMADQIAVMYAGRFVESGNAKSILQQPRHPYTKALKAAVPVLYDLHAIKSVDSNLSAAHFSGYKPLQSLPGTPPDPSLDSQGCTFAPRCSQAMNICLRHDPLWTGDKQSVRCWLMHETYQQTLEIK
jgi:oligopeptide transport system ATP-binding protein